MGTKSHRIQVLLTDSTQTRVDELAKASRRSLSAMCGELIDYALDHGFAETTGVPPGALVLNDNQKRKLLKLLDAMD